MKERREGMDQLFKDVGYLVGRTDGLHTKMDGIQEEVKSNTKKVNHVEKRLDKYRNLTAGASGIVGGIMVYLDEIKSILWGD